MWQKMTALGRVVADAELRVTTSGKQVAGFRLAVDRPGQRRDDRQNADFFDCVWWGNGDDENRQRSFATLISYVKKGRLVLVNGRVQLRTYDKQDGSKGLAVEVVLSEPLRFCDSKRDGSNGNSPPPVGDDDDPWR